MFTFKKVVLTGRMAWVERSRTVLVKLNKKECGCITQSRHNLPWRIKFTVMKNGINITDNNPNCSWKWITIDAKFETEEQAREWILQKAGLLRMMFTFHTQED